MCADGVGNVTDVDGVHVFVVRLPLHKYLPNAHIISMNKFTYDNSEMYEKFPML